MTKRYFSIIALAFGLFVGGTSAVMAEEGPELPPAGTNVRDTASLQRGAKLFFNYCVGCHSLVAYNAPKGLLGPNLANVGARSYIAAGTLPNTDENLAHWIRFPQEVKHGVLMPNLGLGRADAEVLIDYLKKQSAAATDAPVTQVASHHAANLSSIVAPYLGIQRALSADLVAGVRDKARTVALEAAKLGAEGASIGTAAAAVQQAGDLEGARASFGRLGDAILRYARAGRASLGAGVKVAYCPMTRQYWLQEGDTVRNPFFGSRMSDCGRIASEISTLTY